MNGATAPILGWALSEDDRIAIPYPYTHIGGFCVTVSAMYTGARLLFTDIFDAVQLSSCHEQKGSHAAR